MKRLLLITLALSIATTLPVLGAPGTGMAASAVGAWALRREVLLILDTDDAGRAAASRAGDAVAQRGGHYSCCEWDQPGDVCDVLAAIGAEAIGEAVEAIVAQIRSEKEDSQW